MSVFLARPEHVGAGIPLAVEDQYRERVYPFNALGWPALALPCGPAEDGLPSVQLAAPLGEDGRVPAAGALLEIA